MRVLLACSFLLLSFPLVAAEGMWVPEQLPEIAAPLKKAGLKLDPKQLADLTGQPVGAVISLGGCTASFVSPITIAPQVKFSSIQRQQKICLKRVSMRQHKLTN